MEEYMKKYYEYEKGALIAYNVTIDIDKLEQIRDSIIKNCSVIRHGSILYKKNASVYEVARHIERCRKTFVDVDDIEYVPCYGCDNDLYKYDEYIYPEIINIIDNILKGQFDQIKVLYDTKDMDLSEQTMIKYKYGELLKAIFKLEKYILTTHKNNNSLLNEAKYWIEKYRTCELTLPKKSIKDYYGELETCVKLEKVGEFSPEEIAKLNDLKELENNNEASVDHQYVKKFDRDRKGQKK